MPSIGNYTSARINRRTNLISGVANLAGSIASTFLESEINDEHRNARAQALQDIAGFRNAILAPENPTPAVDISGIAGGANAVQAPGYDSWMNQWREFSKKRIAEISDGIKLGEARKRFEADWAELDATQSEWVAGQARARQEQVNVRNLQNRLSLYVKDGRYEEITAELDSAVAAGTVDAARAETVKQSMVHDAQYNLAREELAGIAQNFRGGMTSVLELLSKPGWKYLDLNDDDRTNLLRDFTNMKATQDALADEKAVAADKEAVDEMVGYVVAGDWDKLNPADERLSAGNKLNVLKWKTDEADRVKTKRAAAILAKTEMVLDAKYRSGTLTIEDLDGTEGKQAIPYTLRAKYRAALEAQGVAAEGKATAAALEVRKGMWERNELAVRAQLEVDPSKVEPLEIINKARRGEIDPANVEGLITDYWQRIPAAKDNTAQVDEVLQFNLEQEVRAGAYTDAEGNLVAIKTPEDVAKRVIDLGFSKPDTARDEGVALLGTLATEKENARKVEYAKVQQFTYDVWGDDFDRGTLTTNEIERRASVENKARDGVIPEEVQEAWRVKVRQQEKDKDDAQTRDRRCAELVYDYSLRPEVRSEKLKQLLTDGKIWGDDFSKWDGRIQPATSQQSLIILDVRKAYQESMVGKDVTETKNLTLEMLRATDALEDFFRKFPAATDEPKWIAERDRALQTVQKTKDEDLRAVVAEVAQTTEAMKFATGEGRGPALGDYQGATVQEALRERGRLRSDLAAKFDTDMQDKVHSLSMDVMVDAGLVTKRAGKVPPDQYSSVYFNTVTVNGKAFPDGEWVYSVGKEIQFNEEGQVMWNDSMYMVRTSMENGTYTPEVWKLVDNKTDYVWMLYHRWGAK